ncbi:hypothetical protein Ancab_010209 [Ancistrocladus abbreviatus]
MTVGLRRFTERTGDAAGRPVLDTTNGEDLMHVQEGVAIVLGNHPAESPGTLYITSRRVIWLSDSDSSKGYAVDFLSISLHAVSRDPLAYPSPCIYAQIETEEAEAEEDDSGGSESESDTGPLELSKVKEMRLVPSDANQLDRLFEVFCECAELNPEPIEDQDEENDWVFGADQIEAEASGEDSEWNASGNHPGSIGHANGHHDLVETVLQLEINDRRFEDAEEMEEDSNNALK